MSVIIRRAAERDVPAIVELLADDSLGAERESDDLEPYLRSFRAIDADGAHHLAVAEDADRVVGTLQLTLLPGLSRGGALRGQIEAVRVARDYRSRGLGVSLLEWAIAEARRRGCALVQLTTDTSRTDAHRFYERLGFTPSHVGYKLQL